MDPELYSAVQQAVKDCVIQPNHWHTILAYLVTIVISAVGGKVGVDFWRKWRYKTDETKRPVVDTPIGLIPERRKWDPDRCGEHLSRIRHTEESLSAIVPEMAKMNAKITTFIERLDKGDAQFTSLNSNMASLDKSTALLSQRIDLLLGVKGQTI